MDHSISLEQAITMTRLYRLSIPAGMPLSETFQIASIKALLSEPDCTALRIYYGKKEDGTIHAILVGVNEKGEDITDGIILEEAFRCPPICTANSPLTR